MVRADIPGVVELERASFGSPWTPETFARILENDRVELWVAVDDGLAGYAVLWCVADQGELANIAVAPAARRRGIGGRLLDWILEVARRRGVTELFLEVRESNRPARELYRTRGFREAGRRRNYYQNPREDALILVRRLDSGGESP
jgi:ribosomal-protein-alanine N-acetyltransferase